MAYNQRSRSPSAGRIQQNHSPSPHQSYENQLSAGGLDPSISNNTFTTGKFNSNNYDAMNQNAFNNYSFQPGTDQAQYLQHANLTDNHFYDNGQIQNQFQSEQIPSSGFNAGTTLDDFIDPTGGQGGDATGLGEYANPNNFDQNYIQQPPQYQDQFGSQALNQQNLSHISSPHIGTPQHLLSPEDHTSPGHSPSSSTGHYYTPQHSRHESLDPSSAAYPVGQEWQGMSFQGHRRMASDQSDISSSAAPSPYLGHQEHFESFDNNHSPSMVPLNETNDFSNAFGMETINLADQNRTSPYHSAHASPRISPQQTQGLGLGQDFSLTSDAGQMNGPGPEIFTTNVDNALQRLHEITSSGASDMGQANQFPVPTIDIEPAPVSRQASFEPEKGGDPNIDALSPPSRIRGRSKSDPHMSRPISRSVSPGAGHVRSPSLAGAESLDSHSVRSLSPMAPLSTSRDHSPGAPNRVDKNRRSSTSSLPSRDYILDLADPERPNASPNAGNTRVQKHPATFQCHLCPKRFTRAYNLRSHLRTHTDERPFVCTVCGKAFARQHDRKRHEGLHSGEKKFVCKGELSSGGQWGCGRRFARADALGRHFRSEAGRVCIKPLLDEEAIERDRQRLLEQQSLQAQQQHMQQPQMDLLQPVQQPMVVPSQNSQFMLPAALLAQYPALNNIDWSTLAQGDDPGELSDMGGGSRNSFDASSGNEFYEDDEYGAGGISGGEGSNSGAASGSGGAGLPYGQNQGQAGWV